MFHFSKTLCTYTIFSNFCKVTASLLKWLSFSDKEMFSFEAMNSSKWLQLIQGFAEYSWMIKFEAHLMALRTTDQFWTQFQPRNSHWFSVFSRSHVFVDTYLLVLFKHHQSSSTDDLHCIGGSMEQYPHENNHKPETKLYLSTIKNTSRETKDY